MSGKIYHVKNNPNSMSGDTLFSAQEMKIYDHCCGIHGAARERKGAKHGASTYRRRLDKELVTEELGSYWIRVAKANDYVP
jgi:hypothetical protein